VDADLVRPVAFGILLIRTLIELYPTQVKERLYPTAANPTGSRHLDKLIGIENAFNRISEKQLIEINIADSWMEKIHPYLLYPITSN
jgi:uncharacterized protein YbbC (DUF1343 family)